MSTGLTPSQQEEFWPPLPYEEWQDTAQTLHLWTQIVGKVRLTLTTWVNHSWHVTLRHFAWPNDVTYPIWLLHIRD